MKNISLVKVTFAVVSMALASSLVNANEQLSKNIQAISAPKSAAIKFEQLDLDKNNLLSLIETEKYKAIYESFTKIDSNDDANISKDEFKQFTKL